MKNFISKWWEVLLTVALIIFNIGYTIARIEEKPSRDEVKTEIKKSIDEYENKTKDSYVRIDQVPGLIDKLEAINEKLNALGKRFDKIEDKIIFGKN